MTDTDKALETLRDGPKLCNCHRQDGWDHLPDCPAAPFHAAIATIEAELTRLRERVNLLEGMEAGEYASANRLRTERNHAYETNRLLEAERDEAVAALREVEGWACPSDGGPGFKSALRNAREVLARLTPKEPTDA